MNVYEHFSCHTKLPIRLRDIKAHILETRVVASIRFVGADLNPQVVGGFLHVFRPSGNDPHALIFYSLRLSPEWRRLVICKELLHILDNHEETAQTREKVDLLISEISAPLSISTSIPAISDHVKVLPALSVLLPRDSMDVLRPLLAAGRLNAEAVAKLAKIPEGYADFLLSPAWTAILESI